MSSHSQVLAPAEPTRSLMLQLLQERNLGVCEPDSRKEPNSGIRPQHLDTASLLKKAEQRKSVAEDLPSVFSGASLRCR